MTKGAIKAIAVALAVALVGATVAAGVGSAKGGKPFQNPHIETWFNNWGKPAAQEQAQVWGGVIDNVGNEMNAETTYAMPVAMAFYSTFSDDVAQNSRLAAPSVTVTCSHNFEFNNVLVDWSVEYPSGASAADVVTVTPTSNGSLTANVSCTAPAGFDTQLTLKVTERGGNAKTATCKIDYVKRINSITSTNLCGSDFDDDGDFDCTLTFGVGTVKGNLKVNSATFQILDNFQNEVKKYLKFDITFKNYTVSDLAMTDNSYESTSVYSAYDDIWTYDKFIQDFDSYDQAHKNAIYYAWYTANYNGFRNTSNISINIDIAVIYNGNVIQSIAETDYIETGSNSNRLSGDCYGSDVSPNLTLNGNFAL